MFWDRFQKLCESVGKAPNTVAAEIGIASGTLTNWKNGGMPRWKAIDKICGYFHVTRDYFFPPDQIEKPVDIPTDALELNSMLLRMTDEQIAKLKDIAAIILGE